VEAGEEGSEGGVKEAVAEEAVAEEAVAEEAVVETATKEVSPPKLEGDGWNMVCRPKVGGRVVGGGFLGVFRRLTM
jgi:tRNA (adenine57-N1/adenine58-N1)-methyltransferase